jgi:hypothetical protein
MPNLLVLGMPPQKRREGHRGVVDKVRTVKGNSQVQRWRGPGHRVAAAGRALPVATSRRAGQNSSVQLRRYVSGRMIGQCNLERTLRSGYLCTPPPWGELGVRAL